MRRIGALMFNVFGIFGGFLSPTIGRVFGLRIASAVGFAAVFVMLLILGLFSDKMPIWLAAIVPSLFILFHSGGPGANGKSLSSLSFRSELRAGANGVIGALGSIGAALGLLVFPLFREWYGLNHTFLILSAVPLIASIICFSIKWDPTRTAINPDNEAGAPQFADDTALLSAPHCSRPSPDDRSAQRRDPGDRRGNVGHPCRDGLRRRRRVLPRVSVTRGRHAATGRRRAGCERDPRENCGGLSRDHRAGRASGIADRRIGDRHPARDQRVMGQEHRAGTCARHGLGRIRAMLESCTNLLQLGIQLLPGRLGAQAGFAHLILWAARHIRDTTEVAKAFAEKRLCFGTVDTWLLWHLSRDRIYVTTPTNATSAGAYVLAEHRYQYDWLDALAFPHELLPELRSDADDLGRTDHALLGIDVPILASMGDQHAGAIGLGCLDRGQAMCIHGTGSFVDLIIGPEQPAKAGLFAGTTTMVARRRNGQSHFAVETFAATTGSALDWVCEKLRWFESATEISRFAAEAKSSNGVTFIPALTGLRTPDMQPNARASLTGISMASTRPEVAYAILEGIAHSVASCLESDRDVSGVYVAELIVGAACRPAIRCCRCRRI
jgi:hypothetical protein